LGPVPEPEVGELVLQAGIQCGLDVLGVLAHTLEEVERSVLGCPGAPCFAGDEKVCAARVLTILTSLPLLLEEQAPWWARGRRRREP
jgi:hypothetical protein